MLAVEAQQEADMYWASHSLAREDAGEDEQGRIGTRVRIIGKVSLSAEWYRNRFVSAAPNEKKLVFRHTSRRVKPQVQHDKLQERAAVGPRSHRAGRVPLCDVQETGRSHFKSPSSVMRIREIT